MFNHNDRKRGGSKRAKQIIKEVDELIESGKWEGDDLRTLYRYLTSNRKYVCEICGISTWNNKSIKLEIHHKDGNYKNNKLNNVILICPNCHSQTDNYKSKNIGNGRKKRRKWW